MPDPQTTDPQKKTLTLAQLYALKNAGHNYIQVSGGWAGIDELIKNPELRTVDPKANVGGGSIPNTSISDFFGPDTPAAATPAATPAAGTAPIGSYASLTSGTGGAGSAGGTQSYLGAGTAAAPASTTTAVAPQTGAQTMANGNAPQIGQGYYGGLSMPNGQMLSAADSQKVMALYDAYKSGDQVSGKTLSTWMAGAGFNQGSLDAAVTNLQQGTGPNQAPPPESVALQQMAQIDPTSEALRGQLGQSYLTPLAQAGTPTAGQFKSLLDVYGQVDPTGAAARTKLGSDLAAQEALGTQLDPATQRQLEQQTRIAQGARGNVYGTPQLVAEAMTTGQAGLALQQQRQQALQGYLTSGATTGDLAMNLYNQQQNQLRASQGAALSYLGSGQTPYQAGASYLNTAEQRAAAAAQGGAGYNPQGPSPYYTGAGTSSFPQYGLDTSQTASNWYNLMNAYNTQGSAAGGANKTGKAATGALSGAASGAAMGTAVYPGVGTLVGAGVGALAGGAGGYFG